MDVPTEPRPTEDDHLGTALDRLPAMVGYWDRDQCNRLANAALRAFFGRTAPDLAGMTFAELVGPERYEQLREDLEAALAGEPRRLDRMLEDAGGRHRHVQVDYLPDVVDGTVRGVIAFGTDVTRRVEAELALRHSNDLYRSLVRSTPAGFVAVFDGTLRYTLAEGEALSAWGLAPADLEGRRPTEVFDEAFAADLERRYRAALAGRPSTWERRRGSRWFAISAGPVRDEQGNVFAGIAVGTDVTERRRREATLEALHAITAEVARNASPDEVIRMVAEQVRALFDVHGAAVTRFDGPDRATILAHAPGGADIPTEMRFSDDDGSAAATVARTGRPAVVRYTGRESGVAGALVARGARSGAAAPVHVRGELWGAVNVVSGDPDHLDEQLLERLTGFAHLLELAIGNADAIQTLARHAMSDGLTGLPNLRAFREQLAREVGRAERYGEPLSVVIVDVDHFKAVNDTLGHPVGDRVLVEMSRRLLGTARSGELVARVGGEEFAWILPETTGDEAFAAAERARAAVGAEPFAGVGRLTVSAGVCDLAEAGDAETLMRRADQALYVAKEGGRDATFRYSDAAREALAHNEREPQHFQMASSLRALARAVDAKRPATRDHSPRVARLAQLLALELGWTGRRARELHTAALVHDVGKVGLPDSAAGALDGHAEMGARMVSEVLGADAVAWVRAHHERWDGTGGPAGLAAEAIPDGARILAVADAWDGLTGADGPARHTAAAALEACRRGAGTRFDPAVVAVLEALEALGALRARP